MRACSSSPFGEFMWVIMRKPTVSIPSSLRDLDVLLGDVRLGAVHRDAHDVHAEVAHLAQVVDGADAGDQQHGDARRSSSR